MNYTAKTVRLSIYCRRAKTPTRIDSHYRFCENMAGQTVTWSAVFDAAAELYAEGFRSDDTRRAMRMMSHVANYATTVTLRQCAAAYSNIERRAPFAGSVRMVSR